MNSINKTYIIYDIEGNEMPKGYDGNLTRETIEVGAVKVINGKIENWFHRFVKPSVNPLLTKHIKQLTNISQDDINQADGFLHVMKEFEEWAGEDCIFLSWGKFDFIQLRDEYKSLGETLDWIIKHANLQKPYTRIKGFKDRVGLKNALIHEELSFQGQQHNAVDDAKNTARILVKNYSELEEKFREAGLH